MLRVQNGLCYSHSATVHCELLIGSSRSHGNARGSISARATEDTKHSAVCVCVCLCACACARAARCHLTGNNSATSPLDLQEKRSGEFTGAARGVVTNGSDMTRIQPRRLSEPQARARNKDRAVPTCLSVCSPGIMLSSNRLKASVELLLNDKSFL